MASRVTRYWEESILSSRTLITAVALAGLLAGLAGWLLTTTDQDASPETPVPLVDENTGQGFSPAESTGHGTEPVAEPPAPVSPARRIRHGVAAQQETGTGPLQLQRTDNEQVDRLIGRVEAALNGDIDQLVELTQLISNCRFGMENEDQVQRRLDRIAQANAYNPDGPMMPGRGGGSVEFRSFEDLETEMWSRYDQCQVASGVLDETLYEQVLRLAESGLPSARYLYAVWPPDQGSPFSADTLEMLEYQSLALEYTWLNLQQRDPLGLLAMAQSYGARRQSFFTPTNPLQGQVFRLAAMRCGVENDWLEERTQNFGQGLNRFVAGAIEMPSLDEDAALLAEMFCPAPPAE